MFGHLVTYFNSCAYIVAVTCWEIFEHAKLPYGSSTNMEISYDVKQGKKLPMPSRCPEYMFKLMLQCWEIQPSERPTFAQVIFNGII